MKLLAYTPTMESDSSKHKTISLDSLSEEDLLLLKEYEDTFKLELEEIKKVFRKQNLKSIDTSVAILNKASHFEIGLDFTSQVLSNGRKSGAKGVAFYPSVMYYHKWGLYAVIGMGFYTDSFIRTSAKVPVVFFSPGFSRIFFKKWTLNTSYSRNFTLYGNTALRGLLNNTISLYNSYDFWRHIILSANLQFRWSSSKIAVKLGEKYSTNLELKLKKDFSFFNIIGAKMLTLTPEISTLFGNDNSTFIVREQNTRRYFAIDKFFGLLDIEPGFTIDWRIRNVEIYSGFHVAIPFNEFSDDAKVRITNPHHYYPYTEAGIKYLFRIKKEITIKQKNNGDKSKQIRK